MMIETWCQIGWDVVDKTRVTTEELGYTDEKWRLLGDADKEKALKKWWFDQYLTIGHEVSDE
jgi:hypothetical protein